MKGLDCQLTNPRKTRGDKKYQRQRIKFYDTIQVIR
jgi:hypothetical protein